MFHAAIGGMQLKRWTGYFRVIGPTLKVLRQAKRAKGCLKAETFKSGKVLFAVSVWDDTEDMRRFARGGLHGQLAQMAMDEMALFYNHSQSFDEMPDRDAMTDAWKVAIAFRDGRGTVGTFVP